MRDVSPQISHCAFCSSSSFRAASIWRSISVDFFFAITVQRRRALQSVQSKDTIP